MMAAKVSNLCNWAAAHFMGFLIPFDIDPGAYAPGFLPSACSAGFCTKPKPLLNDKSIVVNNYVTENLCHNLRV